MNKEGKTHASAYRQSAEHYRWGLDRICKRTEPLDGTYSFNKAFRGEGTHFYPLTVGKVNREHVDLYPRVQGGFSLRDDYHEAYDSGGYDGTPIASAACGNFFGVARHALIHPVTVLSLSRDNEFIRNCTSGLQWVLADYNSHHQPSVCYIPAGINNNHYITDEFTRVVNDIISAGIILISQCDKDSNNTFFTDKEGVITLVHTSMADSVTFAGARGNFLSPDNHTGAAGDGPCSANTISYLPCSHTPGVILRYLSRYPQATYTDVKNFLDEESTKDVISGVPPEMKNHLQYMSRDSETRLDPDIPQRICPFEFNTPLTLQIRLPSDDLTIEWMPDEGVTILNTPSSGEATVLIERTGSNLDFIDKGVGVIISDGICEKLDYLTLRYKNSF